MDETQPIISINGEKAALGPLRRDLVPLYLKWVNDFEVTRMMKIGFHPVTLEAEESWYERIVKDERSANFTIYERATMRPIGNTGLTGIDHASRTANFGILIGEKDCWGKGHGTETTTLMLDYGFNGLGLHNILLTVLGVNERAIRAYTRAGFRLMGRRREARRLGGVAHDEVYMDCLSTEFQSPVLHRLLPGV